MSRKYKLIKKYPSLPSDWEVGMIVELVEIRGSTYFSPCNSKYTEYYIPYQEVVNNIEFWEDIIVNGTDDEWTELNINGRKIYQNKKCSGILKENGKYIYKHAIMWNLKEKNHKFNGMVYIDTKNFEMIGSAHYVKSFPFIPKTFYIDIELIPITKEKIEEKKLDYVEDNFGKLYIKVIKDPSQLNEVFNKFYIKKKNLSCGYSGRKFQIMLDRTKFVIEKVAFECDIRGYYFKATYLEEPKGEALIEISKDGKIVREFLFPAYKIWNISAHAYNIIDGLEKESDEGLLVAESKWSWR